MVKKYLNPKNNNDDKCFQYVLSIAINYEQIKKILKKYQKISFLLIILINKRLIF